MNSSTHYRLKKPSIVLSAPPFDRRSYASLRIAAFGRFVWQRGFRAGYIFAGLQLSKMTVHPWAVRNRSKNSAFQKTAGTFGFIRGGFLVSLLFLSACAAVPKQVPYPVFLQADELVDIFMVGLPGIRAKQLSGNPETRRSSNRLLLPADWSFTTGASPDKSVEIYVLTGEVQLGEFTLGPGGYAYIPPGSTGLGMITTGGASLLYFLDNAQPDSMIQTPMILSRDILSWQPISDDPNDLGVSIKELRHDPGSGVRTFLLRMNAGATRPWRMSSIAEEGYLLQGTDHHSECVAGKILSDGYTKGGYYHRPPGAANARLADEDSADAVWLVRTQGRAEITRLSGCEVAQE